MIAFSCPACGKELKVKNELIGQRRRCPFCQTKVAVPEPHGEGQKTQIRALPNDAARTLAPSANPRVAAKTQTGDVSPPKPTQIMGETLAPDGAALFEPASELTKFLQPAQEPGELGRLGKYRVVKILGVGGMGIVFQAEDTVLKRAVALKALLPSMNTNQRARDRFLREAQSAAALQHDNVATVFDVSEANGVPFLAMELLKGETLEERLAREKTLPLADVLRIGQQTAEGLGAAHEIGLIHRDVKPPNLFLVAPHGRVKILDFGLARTATDNLQLTRFGAVVGTLGYLSPEQARAKPIDGRADLFSLGCVLHRLVTGEQPFKGKDTLSILTALATSTPPPPNRLNPEVPAPLSDLIVRLLSKNRDHRPRSAREVSDALHAIEVGLASAPIPVITPIEEVEPDLEEVEPDLEEVEPVPAPPAPAPITQAPLVPAPKIETVTTDRPVPRPIREGRIDRIRRPRRRQAFPLWIAWAGGVALLLLVGGATAFFLLRSKDKAPSAAEAKSDDSRPRPRDQERPTNTTTPPLAVAGSQWLTFSPDNQHFVSAAPNGDRIVVWDRRKREPEYAIDHLVGGITQAPRYSSDGNKLIVGIGQSAAVYDMSRKQTAPLSAYAAADIPRAEGRFGHGGVHADRLLGVGFAANDTPLGVFYGVASNKRVLGLFDVEHKRQRANGYWFFQDGVVPKPSGPRFDGGKGRGSKPPPDATLKAAIPTPDGWGIIVVDASGMRVWIDDENPARPGWTSKKIPSFEQVPTCFALAPDGKTFLTSHGRNEVRVWNAKTGEGVKSLTFGKGSEIVLVGFSPDSKLGMCCARDGKIYVWDAETGTIRAELPGQAPLFAMAISPDLRTLIASSPTGDSLLWFALPPTR